MCAELLTMECLLVDAVYCATPGCFISFPPSIHLAAGLRFSTALAALEVLPGAVGSAAFSRKVSERASASVATLSAHAP